MHTYRFAIAFLKYPARGVRKMYISHMSKLIVKIKRVVLGVKYSCYGADGIRLRPLCHARLDARLRTQCQMLPNQM
jgi:hypothetical protein